MQGDGISLIRSLRRYTLHQRWLKHQEKKEKKQKKHKVWRWFVIVLLLVIAGCDCEPVRADEVNMKIISTIESNNNPKAVSQMGAVGLTQITYVCLSDYNVYNHTRYTMQDLFNSEINLAIGTWYMNVRVPGLLRHFKIEDTIDNRLKSYNCGIGCLVSKRKLPSETIYYLQRYHALEKK
mgnify:CR=1 FL=1